MILDGVDVFVRVVQAGGFSAAARQLNMPATTVSAKIARLEERLGVTLIQRSTRKMHVTEAGETYYRHCADAIAALATGEEELAAATAEPSGVLRITVPSDLAQSLLPPIIKAYLARYPKVRGIRQQFHWHENPLYRFATKPDLCRAPTVQANVARLADYGWSFDLQVFADQMPGAAELARACPQVAFILQHAGMLTDTSSAGWANWRGNTAILANEPNVYAKLSGFGTFIHRNDADHIAHLIRETVAAFGVRRCLWGSNFPIEKIWTDYASLISAHQRGVSELGREPGCSAEAAALAIFHDTANQVYRL